LKQIGDRKFPAISDHELVNQIFRDHALVEQLPKKSANPESTIWKSLRVILGTNFFGRQSHLSDKVVNQALGWLTLFFTTVTVLSTIVTDCHCQTRHCKMLNTEKWTTE
jgi:hypothetical protein